MLLFKVCKLFCYYYNNIKNVILFGFFSNFRFFLKNNNIENLHFYFRFFSIFNQNMHNII